MANVREIQKRSRLQKLTVIITKAKKLGEEIDKPKLISKMIVEHAITKRTAMEEVEAVLSYDFG